jgi:HD-GYP domain-containing protein (c-di-GMP phosphodiesterase class II)
MSRKREVLQINKVLVPGASEWHGEFQPVPLGLLAGGAEVPFSVYLKVKARPHPEVLFLQCCSRGQVFPRHWQTRMQATKVSGVYVRQEEEERILPYLLHHLPEILARKDRGNREKAGLVYEVARFWLRHLFTLELDRVSGQMDTGFNLIEFLFEIIRREKDPVRLVLALRRQQGLYTHGLHNCLLALAFARYLGWQEKDAKALGLTALVHDIGMTLLDPGIWKKPTPLTAAERSLISNHPHAGFAILKNSSRFRWEALLTVLQHHENGDGSGYPERLRMRHIHPWARILRILDSFEAMISPRGWRPARRPKEALWIMRQEWQNNRVYDPAYLSRFIKFLAGN